MKPLKAETIVRFHDLREGRIREIGEQFTVSRKRFKELEERGLVRETDGQEEEKE